VQDVLFFSDSRPVLIRLHLQVDGKPYATRWNEYLTRWFHFLDRDDDDFLDEKEAARAPSPRVLQPLFSNPYTYLAAESPPLEDLDRDGDKKVSLAEFLRYYRSTPAAPVQIAPMFTQLIQGVSQDALTDALFALLDADKDGKLTRDELAAAETVLHKYDQNDDDLIAVQELLTGGAPRDGVRPAPQPLPGMQARPAPLMLVPREDAPRRISSRLRVSREVLERYDKNKNRSLSRDEIGMSQELFDHLDANRDGELDALELLRWVIVKPDAEAVLRLGRVASKLEPIETVGKNRALRKTAGNTLAFTMEDNCINLIAAPRVQNQPSPSVRQILVQQFKAVDQKGRGFISRKQVDTQQFVYLRNILTVADRDGDDCLDLEELNAWVDLTASGVQCQTSIALASSGRGLFPILDANQDGRLSIRELRNAWTRLAPYDRLGERAVSRNDIPSQYQILVNPGDANFAIAQGGARLPGTPPSVTAAVRGPLWFRKMDRNGDGDISEREFLGSREDFRRLDADGDGLISLEEAMRADEALRKK
jgi:Ca2+-binding EF-hand superfamily protein